MKETLSRLGKLRCGACESLLQSMEQKFSAPSLRLRARLKRLMVGSGKSADWGP